MGKIFAQILPLAIAASVNPTGVLAMVFILSLPEKPVRKAAAFLAGSLILLGGIAIIINLAVSDASKTAHLPPWLSASIDIVFGLMVLYLAIKAHHNQKRNKREKHHKFHKSFFLPGIIYMAVDFSSLVPFVAANKIIASGSLGLWPSAILATFTIVSTLLWLIVPLSIRVVFPTKSEVVLAKLKLYFQEHGSVLVEAMLFIIAVYLIVHGVIKLN